MLTGAARTAAKLPTRSAQLLTDDQATFLALLVRAEPATAYQLAKFYKTSPAHNFGTSKGKIYPLVRRLKALDLIRARAIAGDQRGSETLWCTAKGRAALRKWIRQIRPGHLLIEDPFRTMLQSFQLLTRNEQRQWVSAAKTALLDKLDQLRTETFEISVPFHELVHQIPIMLIKTRLKWLDRLEKAL